MGRSSLLPGRYFRLLLIADFERLDSERAKPGVPPIRLRCAGFWI
jgi:hypothetical protein